MMKHFALAFAGAMLLLSSCRDDIGKAFEARMAAFPEFAAEADSVRALKGEVREYSEFLYAYMPLPDMASRSFSFWKANVAKALEVRQEMGWDVPEREFRHFVLPVRVNNETLDDFRTLYADELCERVKGMSLEEAALEINHWCHEHATYEPSDSRTSAPMATMKGGVGRCGEESVLAVAALRAAGIPARQVYTPRWAHTDDNHAWVEVFVDGRWHFLGACEPEPKLDMAWFNAPVSRAMLLHTKAFGDYRGEEDVIRRTPAYTEINVIRGYVPAKRTIVTVLDEDGRPVQGARVEFKIYNYAEFYTVASYVSDAQGHAALDTGCGDIMAWASKGDVFGMAVSSAEEFTVTLDHHVGEEFALDIDVVPPVENPIPSSATEEQVAQNARRLAYEDGLRKEAAEGYADGAASAGLTLLEKSLLKAVPCNWEVWNAFFDAHREDGRYSAAIRMHSILSGKDLKDVSLAVLEDALAIVPTDGVPAGEVYSQYVLCPRVDIEMLEPHRAAMLKAFPMGFDGPGEVAQWVRDSIRVDDKYNPQGLRMPPVHVLGRHMHWRHPEPLGMPPVHVLGRRVADAHSRDIFYVVLCRCFGFPSRVEHETGKVQYIMDGQWYDVDFAAQEQKVPAQGRVQLTYQRGESPVREPSYYSHYTLSQIVDGCAHLLDFEENAPVAKTLPADEGYWMLTSGSRMADGSVLARLSFFNVVEGETAGLPLSLRCSRSGLSVIGNMDSEQTFLRDGGECSILSATGRGYYLIAVMGSGEPTNHAVRQLEAVAASLNEWGRTLVVLGDKRPQGLDNAVFGTDPEGKLYRLLVQGADASQATYPVVAVCDSFNRMVYFSSGYNTSLASDLTEVISLLN